MAAWRDGQEAAPIRLFRGVFPSLGASALALAGLAGAETVVVPDPPGGGWQPLTFRGIDRHTRYTPVPEDGSRALRAESDCAASGLVLNLPGLDLSRTPMLRWRWRVEEAPDVNDERSREGDDFAARVYVLFRFDAARASFFARLRHALGARLFGDEPPGSVLAFVWTADVPVGEVWTSPYADETRLIALARGGRGWRSEAVDVAERYAGAFGHPAPPVLGIGLMTDADQSCGRAVAHYADFRFTGDP